MERGQLCAEQCFGVADARAGARLTRHHVFQAASLAKTVTTWAVLQLAERGIVALDRPVGDYVTRWRFPPSPHDPRAVTIRRILSHTAGLSLSDYPGSSPDAPLPTLEASLSGETNGGADLRVIAAPGEGFRYSGGGFALLQLMIEEATGESFAEHMQRAILAPLGMTRSGFAPIEPHATGHDLNGHMLPFYRFDALAAAGLLSTAGDLARFMAAHLPDDRGEMPGRGLIGAASIAAMTQPVSETGRVDGLWPHYGLGCEIDHRPDGRMIFGHHGMNRGWRALAAAHPVGGRALVLLANSDRAMPALEAIYENWV